MTRYPTPQRISATIQVAAGDIRLESSARTDTVVEVAPGNPSHEPDVEAAQRTSVEYADGQLRVIGPKGRTLRRTGTVLVTVSLPAGSHVDAATGMGRVVASGRLGDGHVRSGAGDIQVGDTDSVDLVTGIGALSAGHVSGSASCVTGSGSVRIARVDGSAVVKNSNGDTWIGEVGADLRVRSSNGAIRVDRARGDVKASTANGEMRIGRIERGTVDLKTALGRIEVGVAEGTAARLDLHTSFGSVITELDAADGPLTLDTTVLLSAETSAGDILIRRALTDDREASLPS